MSELEVHGDSYCGCGTCRECTERERAEKAEASLAAAERRMRELMEAAETMLVEARTKPYLMPHTMKRVRLALAALDGEGEE